jgi:L-alanine-DL-glutamate epimerase-like enolase superfamily enzyme
MKITSIDIIIPNTGGRACDGTRWNPVFLQINTDEGLTGFGEIGLAYSDAIYAAIGILQDFCPIIIGMDPLKSEKIWDTLHRSTFWGQGGGTVIFAGMSAIDIALWDIKGKACNMPVYQLLGGKTNDSLRTYASQIQFDWGKTSKNLVQPQEYGEVTKKAMEEGYTCIKVDPLGVDRNGQWCWNFPPMLEYDLLKLGIERVQAIREAGGEELDIIVELHSQTNTNTAIQFGKEIEGLRCFYYEEPTQPLNPAMFAEISRKLTIPLASGERIYSRWGFRPFLEARTLSVIQPDLGNTGGITEGKKICDMAHVYEMGVQLHLCGGPIAIAAALHLETVIPNFLIHEHHQFALLEENTSMCTYDYQPSNGYYYPPELPGIGNEVTPETIKQSRIITIRS